MVLAQKPGGVTLLESNEMGWVESDASFSEQLYTGAEFLIVLLGCTQLRGLNR